MLNLSRCRDATRTVKSLDEAVAEGALQLGRVENADAYAAYKRQAEARFAAEMLKKEVTILTTKIDGNEGDLTVLNGEAAWLFTLLNESVDPSKSVGKQPEKKTPELPKPGVRREVKTKTYGRFCTI